MAFGDWMKFSKRKFLHVHVLVCCSFVVGMTPVVAKGDRGLDDFAKFSEKKSTKTNQSCASASFSKDYEDCCNYYLMGDFSRSDKSLSKVLLSLKDCESILTLQRRAVSRLLFADIPKGSKLKEVEIKTIFEQWLRVSKKTMGVNHRFVGDSYSSLANYYESKKQFDLAAKERMNQYRVFKIAKGDKSVRTLRALYLAANDMYRAKNYKQMEPTVKKVIRLSEQAKFQTGVKNSVRLYIALLKTTKRDKQAQIVAKKYGIRM